MDRDAWAAYTTDTAMQRRAGGRRHYNAVRRFRAELRRRHLAAWLRADAGGWYGQQARAARWACRRRRLAATWPACRPRGWRTRRPGRANRDGSIAPRTSRVLGLSWGSTAGPGGMQGAVPKDTALRGGFIEKTEGTTQLPW